MSTAKTNVLKEMETELEKAIAECQKLKTELHDTFKLLDITVARTGQILMAVEAQACPVCRERIKKEISRK